MKNFLFFTAFSLVLTGVAAADYPAILQYRDDAIGYEFSYPEYYKISHVFPDGTGEPVGVRAEIESKDGLSTEESTIQFLSIEPRAVTALTDNNFETYVEQYINDLKLNSKIKYVSAEKTKMFNQLAASILFDEKSYVPKIYNMRMIATVINGKDYFLSCTYSPGYREEFDYHCKFAAETLKFTK